MYDRYSDVLSWISCVKLTKYVQIDNIEHIFMAFPFQLIIELIIVQSNRLVNHDQPRRSAMI